LGETIMHEHRAHGDAGRGRLAVAPDLRLRFVEGAYTPLMARILKHGIPVMTEREAADFLDEVGLATVSSSTLSPAMAARYEPRRATIEPALRDDRPSGTVRVQTEGEYVRPRGREADSSRPPRDERGYEVVGPPSPADSDSTQRRSWYEPSVAILASFDMDGLQTQDYLCGAYARAR
jgi:hypothetical protein